MHTDPTDSSGSGVAAAEAASIFSPPLRAATIAIMTTVALGAFEGLAVAAALPQVAADLGGVALLPWVLSSYLLVAGVATVVTGGLVDRVGVGPVFKVSIVVFVLGGLLSGIAPSMEVLVVARTVQGIGGGATNAAALAAVALVFPPRLIGRAFAANATVWGVMSIAGPAVAAALLLVASWRWIFLLNVPLGALALLLGWRVLPSHPPAGGRVRGRVDGVAISLVTVFSVATLVALDQLSWASVPVFAMGLACGALALRRTRGRADALVAPRHVLLAPFGPLAWGVALLATGAIGTQLYVPLYVTAGRGASAEFGAWSVMFMTLGWTAGAQLSSRLMDARGALTITTAGSVLVAPACVAIGVAAGLSAPLWTVCALLVVAGAGMGLATNSAFTLIRELASDEEIGRATSAHAFIRQQGFAGGSALAGAVLLLVVGQAVGDVEVVRELLGGTSAVRGAAGAVERGFAFAAATCGGVAVAAHLPLRSLRRSVRAHRVRQG